MAVRHEVVSLSQLLQRRNSARREGSLSLSQPSLSDSIISRNTTPSKSLATRNSTAGGTPALSNGFGPFKDTRPPRDEFQGLAPRPQPRLPPQDRIGGFGLQGFQNLSAQLSQHSQPEIGGARQLSQSQDTQEDSWNGYATSQSQSQTYTSQPPFHARQPSIDIAHSQPRSSTHIGTFSKMIHDSGKGLTASARECARGDEEIMGRLLVPITSSLNDMKTMLSEQSARLNERNTVEEHVRGDLRSLKCTVERLHDYAKKTNQDCEDCHDKIAKEATAARSVYEEIGVRMGAMEKNVDTFITNMSRFVREELFALHVEREQRGTAKTPEALKRATKPTAKRRLVKQTPISRRYSPLPCSTTRKCQRQTATNRESPPGDLSGARRRSIRIEKLRAKRLAEITAEEDENELDDEDDQYGLQLALERVEEARAKRQQQY